MRAFLHLAAAGLLLFPSLARGQSAPDFQPGQVLGAAALKAALAAKVDASRVGTPGGVAPLGPDGTVPPSFLGPASFAGGVSTPVIATTAGASIGGTLGVAGSTNLGGALAVSGQATLTGGLAYQPQLPASAIDRIADGTHRDFLFRWWDTWRSAGGARAPRIRPTNGSGDGNTGLPQGVGSDCGSNARPPGALGERGGAFWQMAQAENVLFWQWKVGGDHAARERIRQQWAYVKQLYSAAELAGDGSADCTVALADDAAWKAQYLAHAHEATGDPDALWALGEMICATSARFADPSQAGANRNSYANSPGGIACSNGKWGMMYAAAGDGGGLNAYGYVSTSYEATWALAALYYYGQTDYGSYRQMALDTYAWLRAGMVTPPPGGDAGKPAQYLVFAEFDLDATGHCDTFGFKYQHSGTCPSGDGRTTGGSNPYYHQPVHAYFGRPIRGIDATYMAGGMGMAVLAARLYQATGLDGYRVDAANFLAAQASLQGYGRAVGGQVVFSNTRDPWTDGYWAPAVAWDVLPLPGVDPAGAWRAAAYATVGNVFAGSSGGNYTADWAGGEYNFLTGRSSWEADYAASPGNQAGAAQVMTTATTISMMQAGWIVDRWSRRR